MWNKFNHLSLLQLYIFEVLIGALTFIHVFVFSSHDSALKEPFENKFKCSLKQKNHNVSLPAFSQKQPVESQNEGWVVRAGIGFLSVFLHHILSYYFTPEPLCLWKRRGKVISSQWQHQLGARNGTCSFQLSDVG